MPDTISPPNPHTIDLSRDVDVWQYPAGADVIDDNPAAEARNEYLQHQYVEQLAAPDAESVAFESGAPLQPIREGAAVVNEYETVPAPGEVSVYTQNTGETIDPRNSEAVLAAATHAVNSVFGPTPEMVSAVAARESREQQNIAVKQAGVYAPRVEDMRDRALIDWGMPGSNSLN